MQDASIKVQHSDALHPRPCQKAFVITSMHGWMYAPHTFMHPVAPPWVTLAHKTAQSSVLGLPGCQWDQRRERGEETKLQ
jgi:hypothetical protein